MKLPVVVGVDGSESSLLAAEWAADEAVLRGLPLRAVYASRWAHYEGRALAEELGEDAEKVRAEDIVGCAARRARRRRPGLDVAAVVVPEEAEEALVHESRNASAVVVGGTGRSGLAEALLGSVGMAVAAHADCPVILVRAGHQDQAAEAVHGCVVVGVGDGAEEVAVVGFAAREARLRGVALAAVRAWRRPAHEPVGHPLLVGGPALARETEAAEILENALAEVPPDVDLRRRTAEGPARRVLAAASYDADLLVLGLRRRAGHYGLQLGRVAQAVLHRSACPVAVVPHL
jgi:nucleotide-binding universal stress UspA family protein